MAQQIVYKILTAVEWAAAREVGAYQGSVVDQADGYIHLSGADQVAQTAARHFAGQTDLVLLGVDAGRLGAALRWEPSRGGQLFPHLYLSLPVDAVVTEHALGLDARTSAADLAAVVASAVAPTPTFTGPPAPGSEQPQ
ncbi:MAG TPA: DUF952 domain-containing protein [Cryptosporangiaceae bacterium]|nr:DUF952 domain-containing protein [Cryptosporangiaceae bacterium]